MSKIPKPVSVKRTNLNNKKVTKKIIVTRRSNARRSTVKCKQVPAMDLNECEAKTMNMATIIETKMNKKHPALSNIKTTGAVGQTASTITKTTGAVPKRTVTIPKTASLPNRTGTVTKTASTTFRTATGTVPKKTEAVPPKIIENRPKIMNRKRPIMADNKTEASVPKVSKPAPQKFAPYDFKGKFNALKEKHITMKAEHLEMKEEINILRKDMEDYVQVKERKDFLESNYEELKINFDELQKNYQDVKTAYELLLEKHSTVVKNYEEQSVHYKIVCEDIDVTKKTLEKTQIELEIYKKDLVVNQELRKKLHNTIQDLKGKIRVFCRCRPQKPDENNKSLCSFNFLDESTMSILKSRNANGALLDSSQDFTFDRVFSPACSQDDIFEDLAQLVQSALDGYNVCVFAYGQTGSGKTYTMMGDGTYKGQGLIPKSVSLLFKTISELELSGWKYTVEASILEIYNENIKDLLNVNCKENLEIKFNQGKGTTVTNLTVKKVKNERELQKLMAFAHKNRAIAATNFNEHSSRSHAVTKIILHGINLNSNIIHSSSLHLVDLAGSECAKNSERIEETKSINKSLANLGNVMLALHNKSSHIPYRNSKLTYLLQPCLGGDSKTLMFVTISPFLDNYNETLNSLRFALKVKDVKSTAKRNKTYVNNDENKNMNF